MRFWHEFIENKRLVSFALSLVVTFGVFGADLLTKFCVEQKIAPGMQVPVTSFFNLVFHFNTGVTFGFLSKTGDVFPHALTMVALFIVVALVLWMWHSGDQPWVQKGLALIVGGAMGNIYDRAIYGGVRDFLDFHMLGWHWPAFNLADACIVIGAGLIILEGMFHPKK